MSFGLNQAFKYTNGNLMKDNAKNKFDEYFTKPEIAKQLFDKFCEVVGAKENLNNFVFVEPSVGNGAFFSLLPKDNTIGIDIKPTEFGTTQSDFLSYALPSAPFIVIGNPPFGHRGVLALEFIKHAQNADFIAFILPMFFQSLGKGSIRYRVPQNLHLLYEEVLPKNSFYTPSGKDADVHCCFQIYSKNHKSERSEFSWYKDSGKEPFSEILKVVTVSLAKNRECGKEWIFNKKADFYLSSTFFKQNAVVDSFEKVKYKSGIVIIYNDLSRKDELDRLFRSADCYTTRQKRQMVAITLAKAIFFSFCKIKDLGNKGICQMNLNAMLKGLIEEKYAELAKFKESGIFDKINEFEANAIGQNNQTNFKLTLSLKDLEPIENFAHKLKEIFL